MNDAPTDNIPLLLDELAANAWSAVVQQSFGRWRLRASGGVTRRANSVFTAGPVPGYVDWLGAVEGFYTRRGLPPRFQVSYASPSELDALLESLGYVAEAFTSVYIGRAEDVLANAGRAVELPILGAETIGDDWLGAFMVVEGLAAETRNTYRGIYSAIGPSAHYVRVCSEDETVGVGMGVTERGWAGLFSIATLAEQRGRGIGTAVVRALAAWAVACRAPRLYLQVMDNNHTAIRLYERLGFSRLYGYHYRTKESCE